MPPPWYPGRCGLGPAPAPGSACQPARAPGAGARLSALSCVSSSDERTGDCLDQRRCDAAVSTSRHAVRLSLEIVEYHVTVKLREGVLMSSMLKYVMSALALGPSVGVASAQSGQPGYHVVRQIKFGGDGRWDYITIDTAGHRLFIARQSRIM